MLIALTAAAAVLYGAQAPAAASLAGTGRVNGVVVTADSGAPVARAVVRLSSPGSAGREAVSDASGRFEVGPGRLRPAAANRSDARREGIRPDVLASARAAADGSFAISPLPAGEYLVAIVDEIVDGEWAEPDALERLREAAVSVKLSDGEARMITLRRR